MRRALLLTTVWCIVHPVTATADELSAADRLRVLYSHPFTFTDDGVPLVSVRLMEGQREVRLSSSAGLRVLPDGEGGPELRAGPAVRVAIEQGKPATLRHWVIVARARTAEHPDLAAAETQWKRRGFEARTFELGTMFGVRGTVLDARQTLLCVAPVATESAAREEAQRLAKTYGLAETDVYAELVSPPSGVLRITPERPAASEPGGEVVLRAPGVVWFAPAGNALLTVRDVAYGGEGSSLAAPRHEDRSYFGGIYVAIDPSGLLAVVNQVPEDRLLEGLLPEEMGASAPAQALEAQAVTARTELLAKIGTRHLVDPYLLCASEHCQVYGGAGKEDPRTSAAVAATRGEVLARDGGGGLVDSVYSADCGGASEDNDLAWDTPADPILRGRLDTDPRLPGYRTLAPFTATGALSSDSGARAFLTAPAAATYCGGTHLAHGTYRWNVTLTVDSLSRSFADLGRVTGLAVERRGASGRALDLAVTGARGVRRIHGELAIRRALGGLRSSLFVVDPIRDTRGEVTGFELRGGGFGHGVGLCQDGAVGMAARGSSYRQILLHYYPRSHIEQLY